MKFTCVYKIILWAVGLNCIDILNVHSIWYCICIDNPLYIYIK